MFQKIRIYGVCNRTFVCFRRLMFCVPKRFMCILKQKCIYTCFVFIMQNDIPMNVVEFLIFTSIIKSTFIRQITFPVDFQKLSCFEYCMHIYSVQYAVYKQISLRAPFIMKVAEVRSSVFSLI